MPRFPLSCKSSWPQARITFKVLVFMAWSQDFLQATTIHGLKKIFFQAASLQSLKPWFPQSCKSSWPQTKLSFELQVFMASSKNFLKAATIHGLKPIFLPSCKCSWP
jgi:hypothetical protein